MGRELAALLDRAPAALVRDPSRPGTAPNAATFQYTVFEQQSPPDADLSGVDTDFDTLGDPDATPRERAVPPPRRTCPADDRELIIAEQGLEDEPSAPPPTPTTWPRTVEYRELFAQLRQA
jgi:hypothetical protein